MPKYSILMVDDEPGIRFAVRDYFEAKGFQVREAGSIRDALSAFRESTPDVAILDYSLPDGDALSLITLIRKTDPAVPLIILTAHASIDLAVTAIKLGAENFLTKPVELGALAEIITRLLENQRNRKQRLVQAVRGARIEVDPFFGESDAMARLRQEAERVTDTDRPLLIQGETGSGKGVLAGWMHRHGDRRQEPFVDLNCAGLSRELLESELFGHERGAFTGAVSAKTGMFEAANRGTLFLDEIGEIDPLVQAKILKVVEDRRYRRVGDIRDRTADVRVIAASHHDLVQLVRDGRFRSDLYFRISTVVLRVPPLRERREDIPLLARRILDSFAQEMAAPPVKLAADALSALSGYSWPGNVRELRNVLERATLLGGGETIHARDLRFDLIDHPAKANAPSSLAENERLHILRVLDEERGNVRAAAAKLGVPRSTLYEKLKRFGIRAS